MRKESKRIIRVFVGVVLVVVGVVGLVLPFLQGIVMIVFGVYLVSPRRGKRFAKRVKGLFVKKRKS